MSEESVASLDEETYDRIPKLMMQPFYDRNAAFYSFIKCKMVSMYIKKWYNAS